MRLTSEDMHDMRLLSCSTQMHIQDYPANLSCFHTAFKLHVCLCLLSDWCLLEPLKSTPSWLTASSLARPFLASTMPTLRLLWSPTQFHRRTKSNTAARFRHRHLSLRKSCYALGLGHEFQIITIKFKDRFLKTLINFHLLSFYVLRSTKWESHDHIIIVFFFIYLCNYL